MKRGNNNFEDKQKMKKIIEMKTITKMKRMSRPNEEKQRKAVN